MGKGNVKSEGGIDKKYPASFTKPATQPLTLNLHKYFLSLLTHPCVQVGTHSHSFYWERERERVWERERERESVCVCERERENRSQLSPIKAYYKLQHMWNERFADRLTMRTACSLTLLMCPYTDTNTHTHTILKRIFFFVGWEREREREREILKLQLFFVAWKLSLPLSNRHM